MTHANTSAAPDLGPLLERLDRLEGRLDGLITGENEVQVIVVQEGVTLQVGAELTILGPGDNLITLYVNNQGRLHMRDQTGASWPVVPSQP